MVRLHKIDNIVTKIIKGLAANNEDYVKKAYKELEDNTEKIKTALSNFASATISSNYEAKEIVNNLKLLIDDIKSAGYRFTSFKNDEEILSTPLGKIKKAKEIISDLGVEWADTSLLNTSSDEKLYNGIIEKCKVDAAAASVYLIILKYVVAIKTSLSDLPEYIDSLKKKYEEAAKLEEDNADAKNIYGMFAELYRSYVLFICANFDIKKEEALACFTNTNIFAFAKYGLKNHYATKLVKNSKIVTNIKVNQLVSFQQTIEKERARINALALTMFVDVGRMTTMTVGQIKATGLSNIADIKVSIDKDNYNKDDVERIKKYLIRAIKQRESGLPSAEKTDFNDVAVDRALIEQAKRILDERDTPSKKLAGYLKNTWKNTDAKWYQPFKQLKSFGKSIIKDSFDGLTKFKFMKDGKKRQFLSGAATLVGGILTLSWGRTFRGLGGMIKSSVYKTDAEKELKKKLDERAANTRKKRKEQLEAANYLAKNINEIKKSLKKVDNEDFVDLSENYKNYVAKLKNPDLKKAAIESVNAISQSKLLPEQKKLELIESTKTILIAFEAGVNADQTENEEINKTTKLIQDKSLKALADVKNQATKGNESKALDFKEKEKIAGDVYNITTGEKAGKAKKSSMWDWLLGLLAMFGINPIKAFRFLRGLFHFFMKGGSALWEFIKWASEGITNLAKKLWNVLKPMVEGLFKVGTKIFTAITEFVIKTVSEYIPAIVKTVKDIINGGFKSGKILTLFKDNLKEIRYNKELKSSNVFESAENKLLDLQNQSNKAREITKEIKTEAKTGGLFDKLLGGIKSAWSKFQSSGFMEGVKTLYNTAKDCVKMIVDKATKITKSIINGCRTAKDTYINYVINNIRKAKEAASELFKIKEKMGRLITYILRKIGISQLFEVIGIAFRGVSKVVGKAIPILGTVWSFWDAYTYYTEEKYAQMALAIISGIACLIPPGGTAVSLVIDTLLFIDDQTGASDKAAEFVKGVFTPKHQNVLDKPREEETKNIKAKQILAENIEKVNELGKKGGFDINKAMEEPNFFDLAETNGVTVALAQLDTNNIKGNYELTSMDSSPSSFSGSEKSLNPNEFVAGMTTFASGNTISSTVLSKPEINNAVASISKSALDAKEKLGIGNSFHKSIAKTYDKFFDAKYGNFVNNTSIIDCSGFVTRAMYDYIMGDDLPGSAGQDQRLEIAKRLGIANEKGGISNVMSGNILNTLAMSGAAVMQGKYNSLSEDQLNDGDIIFEWKGDGDFDASKSMAESARHIVFVEGGYVYESTSGNFKTDDGRGNVVTKNGTMRRTLSQFLNYKKSLRYAKNFRKVNIFDAILKTKQKIDSGEGFEKNTNIIDITRGAKVNYGLKKFGTVTGLPKSSAYNANELAKIAYGNGLGRDVSNKLYDNVLLSKAKVKNKAQSISDSANFKQNIIEVGDDSILNEHEYDGIPFFFVPSSISMENDMAYVAVRGLSGWKQVVNHFNKTADSADLYK